MLSTSTGLALSQAFFYISMLPHTTAQFYANYDYNDNQPYIGFGQQSRHQRTDITFPDAFSRGRETYRRDRLPGSIQAYGPQWRRPHFHNGKHREPRGYRNFGPVFHEFERRWEPDTYNSSAEEADMLDDFNGRALVAPGQYPHMVAIAFRSNSRRFDFKCGGSLISDNFVLTAAHCCDYNGETPYIVKLGDINLDKFERELRPQLRFVLQYYLHPGYNASLHYHDIALIQLQNPIEYTRFVRPIRLWANGHIPYEKVFTMGYGSTSFAQAPTNILTELDLTVVPLDRCNQSMPLDDSAPEGIIESQICAKDFEKNRDTCQGDSGGPLQLNLERRRRRKRYRYYLVGIISYGQFCRGSLPGVYTRVSSYIDWIASIVWPQYFQENYYAQSGYSW